MPLRRSMLAGVAGEKPRRPQFMRIAEGSAYRKKRRVFPIRQQNPRPSTRVAGSVRDCAIDLNLSTSASPSDNSIARRHAAIAFSPSSSMPPHT